MSSQRTSTCSVASAGSVLDSKLPDSEQSDSLKPIPTPQSSSSTTGQTCPILETCAELELEVASVLTSLRVACLASLRACSDSAAVLLTNAGCGLKPSESSATYDPASASLRTRQRSLFSKEGEPGTELCQQWSRSGMIVGGMYFPLPPLVQDISASASSSSLPTPDTQPYRGNSGGNVKKWGGNNSIGSFVRANLLPTPTTSTGGVEPEGTTGRKLITVVSKFLPTPTANDGVKGGEAYWVEKRKKGGKWNPCLNLPRTIAAEMLPTPTARDYKDTPNMAKESSTAARRCYICLPCNATE